MPTFTDLEGQSDHLGYSLFSQFNWLAMCF